MATKTTAFDPAEYLIAAEDQTELLNDALASGDVIHHRIQLAFPAMSTVADTDMTLARTTRQALIERLADSDSILLPAHFPTPVFGRVVKQDRGYAYEAVG